MILGLIYIVIPSQTERGRWFMSHADKDTSSSRAKRILFYRDYDDL